MVGSSDQRGAAKSNSRGPRWPQNARKPRKRSSQARPTAVVPSASNSSGGASSSANSGASGRAASINGSRRTEISVVGLPRMPATSRRRASGNGANNRSAAIQIKRVTVNICMPSRRAPASVDSHSRSSARSAWTSSVSTPGRRATAAAAASRSARQARGRSARSVAGDERAIDHADRSAPRAPGGAEAARREDAAREQIVDDGARAVVDVVERDAQERAEHRDRERGVEVEVDAALDAVEARHLVGRSATAGVRRRSAR